MVNRSDLSQRHQNILKATIKHYIATAEPVASKTLAQQYDFNVSSATIRSVMGRLEEADYYISLIHLREEFLPILVIVPMLIA